MYTGNPCNSSEHKELVSRRDFMNVMWQGMLASSALGVTIPSSLSHAASPTAADLSGMPGFGAAKQVIYVMLDGGFSHMDSFDIKKGVDPAYKGATNPLATNVDDLFIGHWFPKMAKHMDKLCVINSRKSRIGAHGPGQYYVRTGYELRGQDRHPHMGSWMDMFLDSLNDKLPTNFIINSPSNHPMSGWMNAKHAPLPIRDAKQGIPSLKSYQSEERLTKRLKLSRDLGKRFRSQHMNDDIQSIAPLYDDALAMMKSEDIVAFEINKEPEWKREAYGKNKLGEGLILAKRLVEHGVRHVEVSQGGWDHHNNIFADNVFPEKARMLDNALSALLEDLETTGLLQETLVVVTTEMGRSPKISSGAGRDHWPQAFTCLLAGAGIKKATVYGSTDELGRQVVDKALGTKDWCASIAHLAGVPWNKTVYSPSGRPFTAGGKDGKARMDLMAS